MRRRVATITLNPAYDLVGACPTIDVGFGGHVDKGETFEQCAIREIEEEIGIAIADPQVIGISNNLETYHETPFFFFI